MRIACSLIALAATVAATPALADTWRLASTGNTEAPDRADYYINTDSVRRDGDFVNFTTMSVYEQIGSRGYNRAVVQQRGNCASMSSQSLLYNFYAGARLVATDNKSIDWTTHREGSIAYGILLTACGKRPYRGDPTSDPDGLSRRQFAH